jgi:hypothetical protein
VNAFFIPLNQLTILLAVALVGVLYFCFLALKLLARIERMPDAPTTAADDSPSTPQPVPQPQNATPSTNPKIIRLSSNVPAPSSAQEMSQQGKIAAALTRAGLTEPAARPEHPDHHTD